MSIEDALARLDAAEHSKIGVRGWSPPPEIAAKLLELHAAGFTAGSMARALEGTEYAATDKTVRRWLRLNASTP